MTTPHYSASDDLSNMVHSVDTLGERATSLFERLFVGLRRKRENEALLRGLSREVTDLREVADSQATRIAQLTGVLAVIAEGVVMQNNEGRIVLMNQAARELIGSTRHFWTSDLGKMFAQARYLTALDGEITLGKATRVEVNDRIIGAQMAIVASQEGERLGTVLMLRDVTRDALADRLKDQFITQMSHELRTPLAAIKGMSDVLLAMPDDQPPNRRFLEAISRNVAVLDRMIVELLDVSEIGAGSFAVRRNPVDLAGLVFTAVRGHQARLGKRELSLAVQVTNRERLTVTGDERRLHWALNHLLDNAIKYTEPGGSIVVTVGRVREDHVLIEVSDTGVGISPRDLPHIFERFYRGEAYTRDGKLIDPRGIGQGLFVAQAVAEAHGGYLGVASVVGEGSTFKLALPFEPPEDDAPGLREMPAAPPDPDTVDPRAVDTVLPDSAEPVRDTEDNHEEDLPWVGEPPVDPDAATLPNPITRARQAFDRRAVQEEDTDRVDALPGDAADYSADAGDDYDDDEAR